VEEYSTKYGMFVNCDDKYGFDAVADFWAQFQNLKIPKFKADKEAIESE